MQVVEGLCFCLSSLLFPLCCLHMTSRGMAVVPATVVVLVVAVAAVVLTAATVVPQVAAAPAGGGRGANADFHKQRTGGDSYVGLLQNHDSERSATMKLPFTCPSVQLMAETNKKSATSKCTGEIPVINDKDINKLRRPDRDVPMLSPDPRAFHTGVHAYHPRTRKPVLVVFGGCQDRSLGDKALADTWTFDLVRRTWFEVNFDPTNGCPRARFAHAADTTCTGTAIIVFGGFIPRSKLHNTCRFGASIQVAGEMSAETWLLRPQTSTVRSWQRVHTNHTPIARAGHSLTTIGDVLVMFGGVMNVPGPIVNETRQLQVLGDTWVYTCGSPTPDWVQQSMNASGTTTTLPPPRHSHTSVVLELNISGSWQKYVVIFGGTNSTTVPVSSHSSFFNDMWAYHPGNGTWTLVPATASGSDGLPQMRHSHSAVTTADGTMIIQGGAGVQGEHLRDIWEFNPTTLSWTKLQPWFTSPNSAFMEAIRSSPDSLSHRDSWGQVSIALDKNAVLAHSFLSFGGFEADRFSSQASSRIREYVRPLAPGHDHLVLWREAGNTAGPFSRTLGAAALWARPKPANATTKLKLKCSSLPWTWNNVTYTGCAKPIGFDRFICRVEYFSESRPPRCWDRTAHPEFLSLPPKTQDNEEQAFFYDFCDDTSVLLSGGVFNGDADHIGVIDSPGMVWVLTDDFWALDGIVYTTDENDLPRSRTEHAFTRIGGHMDPVTRRQESERFVLFGGVFVSSVYSELLGDVFVFEPSLPGSVGKWTKVSPTVEDGIVLRRAGHSGVSFTFHRDDSADGTSGLETVVYYFGGYAVQGWADEQQVPYPDAFVKFDVQRNHFTTVTTTGDDGNDADGARPIPRWYHSLTGVFYPRPLLVVFGGQTGYERRNSTMLNDLWIFDVLENKWYEIEAPPTSNSSLWPQRRAGHAAHAYGSKVIVFGGKRLIHGDEFLSDQECTARAIDCGLCDLWELDLTRWIANYSQPTWRLLTDPGDNCSATASVRHAAHTMDGRYLNVIGGLRGRLSLPSSETIVAPVGCTKGHYSHSYFDLPCDPCSKGTYAPNSGHFCCISCPADTSTVDNGATEAGQCAACPDNYCKHGSCHFNNRTQRPECHCSFVYLDDRCDIPWVIVFTVVGGFFVFAGPVVVTWYRRYKQRLEVKEISAEQTRQELEEMHQSWMIAIEELEHLHLIGEGACSTVYRADWHNMRVAVKKLRPALLELDPTGFTEDFAREIRVMRSVRHANIVTFYGAGREGMVPFLVTEFMARGSLQDLLQERDEPFPLDVKIRFALDAAKGMRFLHYHNPPWIHRDLKTANLLVNESYTVKVADFGTSRLASLDKPNTTPVRRQSGSTHPTPGKKTKGKKKKDKKSTKTKQSERTPLLSPSGGAINDDREDYLPSLLDHPGPRHARARTSTHTPTSSTPTSSSSSSGDRRDGGASRGGEERAVVQTPTRDRPASIRAEAGSEGDAILATPPGGRFVRSRLPFAESIAMTGNVGTPLYQAPEVISEEPYSVKADVYSFGLVLWEIYTGVPPFSDFPKLSLHGLRARVVAGDRPTVPLDCPEALAQLIRECWQPRPAGRPHFDKIVQTLLRISDTTSKLPKHTSNTSVRRVSSGIVHMPPPSTPPSRRSQEERSESFTFVT